MKKVLLFIALISFSMHALALDCSQVQVTDPNHSKCVQSDILESFKGVDRSISSVNGGEVKSKQEVGRPKEQESTFFFADRLGRFER